MSELALIILAAGQGTRMRSAKPKVLHELAGIPLISHVLATAEELNPAHLIAVVRHDRDAVAAVITEHLPTAIIVDQDEIAGTGRAVQLGLDALPTGFAGHVVILSGDVPLLDAATIQSLIHSHESAGNALTVLSAYFADPTGAGRIIRSPEGAFESIVEHRDATTAELQITEVNAGVYVFDAAALREALGSISTENSQNEMYLTDAAAGILSAGLAIDAVPVHDHWLVVGINDRAQLSDVAAELNRRIVRGWQLTGVTIHDPASTWIDLAADLAPDVEILPNTRIKGPTSIATGAIIGPDTTLVSCEIGEGAIVKRADATLAVIAARATVGPFAYLRPGTYLDENGKIGTFVETKNSRIGRGSKVPHLSYIGDTNIGEGTNIGAGAITANYDDLAKHTTEIGSHVHTGSHNVFVAPVRIGNGAKTGAGTVVRKNVPAGALAITVAQQRNMTGWVEQHRAGTDAARAAAESAE